MKFMLAAAAVVATIKGVANVYSREKLSHTEIYASDSGRHHHPQ